MSARQGHTSTTTRRDFLKIAGGGIAIVLVAPAAFAGPSLDRWLDGADGETELPPPTNQIAAWLHIDAQGAVTVYTGKVEVGQGIRTSLAQHVAEELRVPVASIVMIMGDTDLTPFDQGTFGSLSTPQMGPQLRRAAASARQLLIGLAATHWNADPATLSAADGRVVDRSGGRSVGYGALTAGRQLVETIRTDVPLRAPAEWTVAGTTVPIVGARDIVTGRHHYTSDLRRPGMQFGRMLRPASIGATLASLDDSAARALPGVVVVRDGARVGVVARTQDEADHALSVLRATWTPAPTAAPSSNDIYAFLRNAPVATGGGRGGEGGGNRGPTLIGDPEAALASADHRVSATYNVAYIAHVPLEPRAAVAEWSSDAEGDKLTVWTGTQRPFGVRDELVRAFGLSASRVRVIMPDTGSAYGGKHFGDAAIEAAALAKAAKKPVKLVWTREEEFRWAYLRPAGVIEVSAGVRNDGTITAWTFDNYNSGPASIRPTYAIANQRVEYHPVTSPLRQGSYRGLASTANNFARESHVDELAQLVGMDPLAFRLKNLDDARMRDILRATAEKFGWGTRPPAGHGVGIACGFDKNGYVATCAEVAVDRSGGSVRLVRVVVGFDCGAIVNPDGLRNQVVGGVIQGIGGALFEAIEFDSGVIRNAHLAQYRVPRFADIPPIEVVLLDRKDIPPAGAGEAPIIGLAPAVGSAIFMATGTRPRALPMARGGLKT